jgi:ABC-type transport system involved in multi-copper enzyme maturation permease subunit
MNDLVLLVRTDFQSWLNTIRYDADTQKKRLLGLVAFAIIFFAFFFIMQASFSLIGQGLLRDANSITAVSRVVSFLVGLGTLILIKDAIQGSIVRLYEAPDNAVLLSASISPTVTFASKLIAILGANLFNMVVWLVLPWFFFVQLVERLWGVQFAWYFYLFLLLVCLLLFVIIMTQTIILILVINRFFLSRQVVGMFKVLVAVITIGVIAILSFSFLAIEDSYKFAQTYLSQNSAENWSWYPQRWATNFLLSLHPESNSIEWYWLAQLASVGLALPILAVFTASKIYYHSWELFSKDSETQKKESKIGCPK